jgi:uncharacterized protein YqeY
VYNSSMKIKSELEAALKQAMLTKDIVSKNTLRLVLSAVKEAEVLKKSELEDSEIIGILQKQVKSRQETIDEAEKAERADLADGAKSEIKVLDIFLPEAMSDEELIALVEKSIGDAGASAISDMGAVMKLLKTEIDGRADGGRMSKLVREKLQGK